MRGWLFPAHMELGEAQRIAHTVDMRDEVFPAVTPEETIHFPGGELTVLLVGVGARDNIVRSLLARCASLNRAP